MRQTTQVGALRSVILYPLIKQLSMSCVVMHLLLVLLLLLRWNALLLLLLMLLIDRTLARKIQMLSRYLC